MKLHATVLFAILVLSGCADEVGHGFATLESATLSASLEPGDARELDGSILTNRAYRVTVTRLEIDIASVSLESLSSGSGSSTFDPADPPAGYGSCHGGHCHHEDGRLVEYTDIEAELAAGSGGGFTEIARAEVAAKLDALASDRKRVYEFTPSRELPETEVRKVSIDVAAVTIDAEVTRGDDAAPSRRLVVNLPLEFSVDEGIELRIDRNSPARLRLVAALRLDGTIFDGIEFDDIEFDQSGEPREDAGPVAVISVSDPDDPLASRLASALAASELAVRFDG